MSDQNTNTNANTQRNGHRMDDEAVQSKIMASVVQSLLKDRAFPRDADGKEVFRFIVKHCLRENWMEPPAHAQTVLATAVACTESWLKGASRAKEAADLMLEAKVLFALMNGGGKLGEVLQAYEGAADTFVPLGIRPLWESTCTAEGYDRVTAQPLHGA